MAMKLIRGKDISDDTMLFGRGDILNEFRKANSELLDILANPALTRGRDLAAEIQDMVSDIEKDIAANINKQNAETSKAKSEYAKQEIGYANTQHSAYGTDKPPVKKTDWSDYISVKEVNDIIEKYNQIDKIAEKAGYSSLGEVLKAMFEALSARIDLYKQKSQVMSELKKAIKAEERLGKEAGQPAGAEVKIERPVIKEESEKLKSLRFAVELLGEIKVESMATSGKVLSPSGRVLTEQIKQISGLGDTVSESIQGLESACAKARVTQQKADHAKSDFLTSTKVHSRSESTQGYGNVQRKTEVGERHEETRSLRKLGKNVRERLDNKDGKEPQFKLRDIKSVSISRGEGAGKSK